MQGTPSGNKTKEDSEKKITSAPIKTDFRFMISNFAAIKLIVNII